MDLSGSKGKILRFTFLGIMSSLFALGIPQKKLRSLLGKSRKNIYYRDSSGYGVADELPGKKSSIKVAALKVGEKKSAGAPEKKEVKGEIKAHYDQMNKWFQDNGGCKVEFLVRYQEGKKLLLDLDDIAGKQDYDLFQKDVNGKSKFEIFLSHLENKFDGYVENDEWTLNYKETIVKTCKDYKKRDKTILFFWREAHINPPNKLSFWQIFFEKGENDETYQYSTYKPKSLFSFLTGRR